MVQKEQMIFQLNRIKARLVGALTRIEEKFNNGEINEYTRNRLLAKYTELMARVEGRIVEDEILGEFQIPVKKIEYRRTIYSPDLVLGVVLLIIGSAIFIYTKQDLGLLESTVIEMGTNRTGETWQNYQTSLFFNILGTILTILGSIVTLNELFGKKS